MEIYLPQFDAVKFVCNQSPMKNKLDLNGLLAKYQGYSNTAQFQPNTPIQTNEPPVQREFYDRTQADRIPSNQTNLSSNFAMSKSQCEKYLLGVREQLKNQAKSMNYHIDVAIRQIHQNFQKQHQKIKRQIIQLLDKAFIQNQKKIKDQLLAIGKIQPPQFAAINRKVQLINQNIDKLLHQLRAPDYKKAIAEIVSKDYHNEIGSIKAQIKNAKNNYISFLGEVEHDHQRVNCIKEDLAHLFKISKKHANLVLKIFDNLKQKSNFEIPIAYESQGPSRVRKSFFNFGND